MTRLLVPVAAGILLGVVGLIAADLALVDRNPPAAESIRSSADHWPDRFPNVLLQTHDGRTVRFYDDLIKDKIVALNFMYCACTKF